MQRDPVLHMGPGLHHHVGIALARRGVRCVSVTLSKEEQLAYINLGLDIRTFYTCVLFDMYNCPHDAFISQDSTIVTLFHLGETPPSNTDDVYSLETRDACERVIEFLAHFLREDSCIISYAKSSAADRIQSIFDAVLPKPNVYKDLRMYWL